MKYLFGAILFVVCTLCSGETYKGIGALDKLKDIKNRFPNAKVEKLSPGWLKSDEAIYRFTGEGMAGSIIVKFYDYRDFWKNEAETVVDPEVANNLRKLAQRTDDEALTISWVRWVPDKPIPLERLISKYGKPEESGYSEEDYQPLRNWIEKGLTTYLSDDEKFVYRIDFNFTKKEYRDAYIAQGMPIPPEFMEDENTAPVKKSKKTKQL